MPAPVLGHSLGGMVVLRLALRRPDAVQALVLAAGAGLSIGNVWGRELLSIFAVVRPGRIAARYRSLVSRSPLLRRLVFRFVSVADPVGLTDEAVEGFLAGQLLHTDVDSAWQALRRDDPRQHLEAVRCPVLVLWGAEDVQLPLDDAFEYTRRLRARLRVIPGCGHLLIGERPEPCADAIETFLRDRGLERHHLPAESVRARAEELHPVRNDLDGCCVSRPRPPRSGAKPSLDADLAALREVVGAELRLLVPDRDAEKVGLVRLGRRDRRRAGTFARRLSSPNSRNSTSLARLPDQNHGVHPVSASCCR